MKKLIALILILLIGVATYLGLDIYQKVYKPYKGYPSSVTVEIPQGAAVSTIGRILFEKKIIPSYSYFMLYYKLFYKETPLKSGEFEFTSPLTMEQVIQKLHKGKVKLYKITIKEGMTIQETADYLQTYHKISAQAFIKAAKNVALIKEIDPKAEDLEGYLCPDTYMVVKGTTAKDLVGIMVRKFKEYFSNSMKWRARDIDMSVRDVVTLASLIEKETSSRDERFLISSVFHNRLRIGMALGCDPTVIYALKRENLYTGKIRWKDLKFDSPYNTRIYRGLPPGPICSPGFASIEASLFPENTRYLYFVSKDGRTHYFSKTLKEHNAAVRKYIINRKK